MIAALKLELARAAVEFAEASVARIDGDRWYVTSRGGGGDCGLNENSLPREMWRDSSVEEIKAVIEDGKVRRAAFNVAWERVFTRLKTAENRYLAARAALLAARAAGCP